MCLNVSGCMPALGLVSINFELKLAEKQSIFFTVSLSHGTIVTTMLLVNTSPKSSPLNTDGVDTQAFFTLAVSLVIASSFASTTLIDEVLPFLIFGFRENN